MGTKSVALLHVLVIAFAVSLLMGCLMEEDLPGMNAPEDEGETGGEEVPQEQSPNLIVTDLQAELDGTRVTATFGLRASGQVNHSFSMGLLVLKGSLETWESRWDLDGEALERLNEGQAIVGNRSFELPEWGVGDYCIQIQADTSDGIDEEREDDNFRAANITLEAAPDGRPLAPTDLRKVSTYPCRIEWTDASQNEDGFNIYIGGSCVCCEETASWTKVATVGRDATCHEWARSCCSVAECSCVMVRAFNGEGESPNSNILMLAPIC